MFYVRKDEEKIFKMWNNVTNCWDLSQKQNVYKVNLSITILWWNK